MLTWFRSSWYNRAVVLPCYVTLFDELQREKDRHHLVMDSDDRGERPYAVTSSALPARSP